MPRNRIIRGGLSEPPIQNLIQSRDGNVDVRPSPAQPRPGLIVQPPIATERVTEFSCPHCSRSFTTKTGLGVHTRRAHPDEHDAQSERVDVKARWSEEEIHIMAAKESELQKKGVRFGGAAHLYV